MKTCISILSVLLWSLATPPAYLLIEIAWAVHSLENIYGRCLSWGFRTLEQRMGWSSRPQSRRKKSCSCRWLAVAATRGCFSTLYIVVWGAGMQRLVAPCFASTELRPACAYPADSDLMITCIGQLASQPQNIHAWLFRAGHRRTNLSYFKTHTFKSAHTYFTVFGGSR